MPKLTDKIVDEQIEKFLNRKAAEFPELGLRDQKPAEQPELAAWQLTPVISKT